MSKHFYLDPVTIVMQVTGSKQITKHEMNISSYLFFSSVLPYSLMSQTMYIY